MKKPLLAVMLLLLVLALPAGCGKTAQPPAETGAPTETGAPAQPTDTPAPTPADDATPGDLRTEITPAPYATPGDLTPEDKGLADTYWVAVSLRTEDGEEIPYEAWDNVTDLRLRADGSGIYRSDYWSYCDESNGPLRWSGTGEGFTLTLADGETLVGRLEGDDLQLDWMGSTLNMARSTELPAGEDLDTGLLQGFWALESFEVEGSVYDPQEEGFRSWIVADPEGVDLYWDSDWEKSSYYEENMYPQLCWQPLYYGCPNGYWHADLIPDVAGIRSYELTVVGQDRAELRVTAWTDGEDYPSILVGTYVRTEEAAVQRMTPPEPVTAGTVEELMNAIQDRATIELLPGTYNVTQWLTSPGDKDLRYLEYVQDSTYSHGIYFAGFEDQPELMIAGIRDLTLRSADSEAPAVIVCEPRYSNVITFLNCSGLRLEGLVCGHTPEKGTCSGAVLNFVGCSDTDIHGCDLYGCGAYGVTAESCWGLSVSDGWIHDCTYGCLFYNGVGDASFTNTCFTDCAGYTMLELFGTYAEFSGCDFQRLEGDFLYLDEGSNAAFRSCVFDQAASDSLVSGDAYASGRVTDDRSASEENSRPKG